MNYFDLIEGKYATIDKSSGEFKFNNDVFSISGGLILNERTSDIKSIDFNNVTTIGGAVTIHVAIENINFRNLNLITGAVRLSSLNMKKFYFDHKLTIKSNIGFYDTNFETIDLTNVKMTKNYSCSISICGNNALVDLIFPTETCLKEIYFRSCINLKKIKFNTCETRILHVPLSMKKIGIRYANHCRIIEKITTYDDNGNYLEIDGEITL